MVKYGGLYEGQRLCNSQGDFFEVVEITNSRNVRIRFDHRGVEKTARVQEVIAGSIRLPKYLVGDVVQDKLGEEVKIAKIIKNGGYVFEWPDGYQRTCQAGVIRAGTLMRERDSRRANPKVKAGAMFKNNQGIEFEVVKRVQGQKFLVRFCTPEGFEAVCKAGNITKGAVRYPFKPSHAGVGVLGTFPVNVSDYQYKSWSGMLKRVYKPTPSQLSQYGDCSVSEDWHAYENFYHWATHQQYQEGWHLDKDLLIKGNREYNQDACVYLPKDINIFLTARRNHRGMYPVGVTYHERLDKYQATCNVAGKSVYLGLFSDPATAFLAYKKEKESYAKALAKAWTGVISAKAVDALLKYEVLETD